VRLCTITKESFCKNLTGVEQSSKFSKQKGIARTIAVWILNNREKKNEENQDQ